MRKTKQLAVETSEGPADVTLVQMDGMTAGLMAPKIAALIAPVVASAMADKSLKNYKDLGDAVRAACLELSQGDLESISMKLFTGARVKVKGAMVEFDRGFIEEYFAGQVDSLFKVLLAALELNYAAFFKPLRNAAAGLAQRVTVTPTPTDSSGQPNA
jgi:hypothetical protein